MPCVACATAKAKQKSLPKNEIILKKEVHLKEKSKEVNERMYIDISTVKSPKSVSVTVTKPQWRMMVDEYTGMKWSDFFETKDGMVEPTCEKLYKWMKNKKGAKYIRLDNAGENKLLEKRSNSVEWKLILEFEYNARDTPQQNHLVEIGFSTIGEKGRAMMIAANDPEDKKYKLFREAFTCATMLDWLTVIDLNGVTATRVEHWDGEIPK